MATNPPAVLWTAVDEATATGLSKALVSKGRRRPEHPVNGPDRDDQLAVGTRHHPRAPADQIVRYWLTELARPRPGRRLPPVVVTQIRDLAADRGITLPTPQTQESADA